MAFRSIDQDEVTTLITRYFTPSKEIHSIERLKGRQKELQRIERSLPSSGRHIFIYGDRGVGKTSLAMTAATQHNSSSTEPIYVLCGEGMTFVEVMQSVANAVIPLEDRIRSQRTTGELGLNVPGGWGASVAGSREATVESPKPKNINDALDIMRFVSSKRSGSTVIIIDELDRIRDQKQKVLFAEFIKNIPTLDDDIKVILCGIGTNVDEILGAHPSAGRYFEPVEVKKLNHTDLYEIISDAAEEFKVKIPDTMLRRIGIVSDQFPHFVHLIGDCMFWAMYDDEKVVQSATGAHYQAALTGALQKTERDLAMSYQRATEKSRNKQDFEEALWALADKSDTRRQVTEIFSQSYLPIVNRQKDRTPIEKDVFNQRLHNLRKPSHGEVVVNYGSGWFSFRENVFRGYVRLVAEERGIQLRSDPV